MENHDPADEGVSGDAGGGAFRRRDVLAALGALGAGSLAVEVTEATPGRPGKPKDSEILVGTAPGVRDVRGTVERGIPQEASVVHVNETLGYAAVEYPDEDRTAQQTAMTTMAEQPGIDYAEPNRELQLLYDPDDPLYDDQFAPQLIDAPEAWDDTLGDSEITISVIDGGVKYDHEDLTENMDGSVSNYGRDFIDDDGDPYPDDISTADGDAAETHGTNVAGIAAGGTDNATGPAGVSNCSLLSARVFDKSGTGYLSDIADAVQWSADNGADVINMSLGSTSGTDTLKTACQYAYDAGVVLVAAAGNDGQKSNCDDDDCVSYPAAYSTVLAVSATDSNDDLASFSSVGPEVDVAAPGVRLDTAHPVDTSTGEPGDDYVGFSGTSAASPVVAGVTGLMLSQLDWLSNDEVYTYLKDSAEDADLASYEQGSGRVNAASSVSVPDHQHLGNSWTGSPSEGYGLQVETPEKALVGKASDTSGFKFGVIGRSAADKGRGIAGYADATSGANFGVLGRSASTEGGGVFGFTGSSSGNVKGVLGVTDSPDGTGTLGFNNATSGSPAEGMRGETKSTGGVGVVGKATATSGSTVGVKGTASSSDGYGLATPDDAQVQGLLELGKGTANAQRGAPTTAELDPGENMTYNSDGSDGGLAGDLMYAVNDGGTIKTSVIAQRSNAN